MGGLPLRWWWIGVSALLIAVGSIGPWAKVLFVTVSGTDAGKDGTFTLIASLAALALIAIYGRSKARPRPWWPLALTLLIGAGTAAVGAYDWYDIERLAADAEAEGNVFGATVSVGWGLVLVTIAGASLAAASFATLQRRHQEDPAAATASQEITPPPPP